MNKLGKIITTGLVVASIGVIGANAETVNVGNKKYTFTEFEVTDELGQLVKYNNKDYLFGRSPGAYNLSELIYGDKIKIQNTDIDKKVLDEIYPDGIQNFYTYTDNAISSSGINSSGEYQNLSTTDNLDDEIEKNNIRLVFDHTINNKLYLHSYTDSEQYIYQLQASPYKVLNTIKMSDLINIIKKEGYEYKNGFTDIIEYNDTEDPFIVLSLEEVNTENQEANSKTYIFNIDGTLYTTLNKEILFNTSNGVIPIYNDGKVKFLYSTCKEVGNDCELVLNKDNEYKILLETDNEIEYEVDNGFIIITDNNIVKLYNNNFELIKEYSNISEFAILKELTTNEDFKYSHINNEVQNGNYLITVYGDDKEIISNELLTVEDKELSTTKISGILKDSKGNALKDYKVELNDLKTTTDKNGYFSFTNIEAGTYTLTIKNTEDKIILTKEIIVEEGTETKLEDNTLYFKDKEGINLNLKIDNEEVQIESVGAYKEQNETNPQTYDKTIVGIVGLIVLSIVLFITNKRYKKINN